MCRRQRFLRVIPASLSNTPECFSRFACRVIAGILRYFNQIVLRGVAPFFDVLKKRHSYSFPLLKSPEPRLLP
jgi:hypothetical protein